MQTETLAIRISKPVITALRREARRQRISQGSFVRQTLSDRLGVSAPEGKPAKSGYELVKHLAGICRGGSKDLSTNPKHFEGFGQ